MTNTRCGPLCTLWGLLFAAMALAALAEEPAGPQVIVPKNDVIRLFDGRTLGNCDTWLQDSQHEDPRQVFRVTDGLLHITGNGMGALVTRDAYRDYHLVLEYRWGERTWGERKTAARDSGLLIHSSGRWGGYQGIWIPAIEVQIIEGGVGDFVFVPGPDEAGRPVPLALTANVGRDRDGEVVWREDGRRETFRQPNLRRINWFGRDPDWKDAIDFRGPRDCDSPLGEWTRIDVRSDGGHIEVFVNGTKVNEAFDAMPREGRLQLQSELAEIFVRRWELWPLEKGPKPAAATQRES